MATNRRFILIGKIVVAVVKAPDVILTRIFKEITQASKIRKSSKTKQKTSKKIILKRNKSSQKRPSPAQLKARKLFAMRVKRGDFK